MEDLDRKQRRRDKWEKGRGSKKVHVKKRDKSTTRAQAWKFSVNKGQEERD